ncbi:MAG: hypothetical protein M3419_02090 [Actinomycetota bacterium]|nr:hypothetical protein [Actinomycetota bacterium]
MLGPLCAGLAVEMLSDGPGVYGITDGYSAIFGVSAAFLLLSTLFVRRSDALGDRVVQQ